MVIVNHNSVAPANESLVAAGRQDWKSVIYKLLTDLAIKNRFDRTSVSLMKASPEEIFRIA